MFIQIDFEFNNFFYSNSFARNISNTSYSKTMDVYKKLLFFFTRMLREIDFSTRKCDTGTYLQKSYDIPND